MADGEGFAQCTGVEQVNAAVRALERTTTMVLEHHQRSADTFNTAVQQLGVQVAQLCGQLEGVRTRIDGLQQALHEMPCQPFQEHLRSHQAEHDAMVTALREQLKEVRVRRWDLWKLILAASLAGFGTLLATKIH